MKVVRRLGESVLPSGFELAEQTLQEDLHDLRRDLGDQAPRDRQSHLRRTNPVVRIIRGHALMQNICRGHCELGVDARVHCRVAAAFTELARTI